MSSEIKTDVTAKDKNFNCVHKVDNSGTGTAFKKPGGVPSPEVADGVIEKLAEELYGLKIAKCKQLNGYVDRNYHVLASATSSNPHVTSLCPEGYVIKVVNAEDTVKPDILYAEVDFMRYLNGQGIKTQEAVLTVTGEPIAFYQFPPLSGQGEAKTHAVYARTFIAGDMLYDVTLTQDLCFKLGAFAGNIAKALEGFQHSFYDTFDVYWSLTNIPMAAEYAHVITDVEHRRVVDDVIAQFSSCVLPKLKDLRAGFIHGDLNEQNILVRRKGDFVSFSEDPDEHVIAGILDFEHAARTHPLYDLAVLIAYTSLLARTFDPLEVGGHILAGYTSVVDLPEVEASVLRVCVAGRLVQSLVYGAYLHTLDPTNDYLITTAERGWHVLHALWDTPPDSVNHMWADMSSRTSKDRERRVV